ncbi:MAG: hypothetical protein IID45_05245 [Planctomycetes bacterium]|nr:hypothetical protein [Planctomycetota bacterium]
MSDTTFDEIEQLTKTKGREPVIARLIESLRERKEYNRLFDALLLKKKAELGLPLVQPTSSDDVPEEKLDEFEAHYVETAREIGKLLLQDGDIPQAWVYLRMIREPGPIRDALEALDARQEGSEKTDELINIALYEGVHPVKGLEILLRVNGTCNTVTALDQQIHQLNPADRSAAATLIVSELYDDLSQTVRSEVEQKLAGVPAGESLQQLMDGRDWLFEDGNYHIDVSHLNAAVRFARHLEPGNESLEQAQELAEYGSRLAAQFQYPGDPPFDECYPAHIQYFKVLQDDGREEGLAYFQKQIDAEAEDDDKPMLAFVLVDLLLRIDDVNAAIELANKHLRGVEDPPGFSFTQLCQKADRLDLLRESAREQGDLVTFTATLLQEGAE